MILRWIERWGGVDLDELIETLEQSEEVVEDEPAEDDEPVDVDLEPDPDDQ